MRVLEAIALGGNGRGQAGPERQGGQAGFGAIDQNTQDDTAEAIEERFECKVEHVTHKGRVVQGGWLGLRGDALGKLRPKDALLRLQTAQLTGREARGEQQGGMGERSGDKARDAIGHRQAIAGRRPVFIVEPKVAGHLRTFHEGQQRRTVGGEQKRPGANRLLVPNGQRRGLGKLRQVAGLEVLGDAQHGAQDLGAEGVLCGKTGLIVQMGQDRPEGSQALAHGALGQKAQLDLAACGEQQGGDGVVCVGAVTCGRRPVNGQQRLGGTGSSSNI